jgi:hypothetical protein
MIMPVVLDWYEPEQKNLTYLFSGNWTWEECFAAIDKAIVMLDSLDYPVYLVIDFRLTQHMPVISFDALNRIASAKTNNHPNTRGFIVIGLKHGINTAFSIFRKVFPTPASRYYVVRDAAELETMLTAAKPAN